METTDEQSRALLRWRLVLGQKAERGLGGGLGLAGLGFWPQQRVPAAAMTACGVALLGWSFWMQGRRVRRTSYRHWIWGRNDRVILAIGLLVTAIWVVAWLTHGEWLLYYPYPPYSPWPPFHPVLGLALSLLATPALLLPRPTPE